MGTLDLTDKPEDLGLSSSRLARIRPYFEDTYVRSGKLPGVLTVVARRGQVASLECVGALDLATKAPVGADSVFRMYSMTKPITSVALMSLYEEARFQLDDPVSTFIPELGGLRVWEDGSPLSYRTAYPERDMTVRDLLTHTAGLTYGFMGRHPARCAVPASRRRGTRRAGRAGGHPVERPGGDGGQAGRAPAPVLARDALELQRGHRRVRLPHRAALRPALGPVLRRADLRAAADGGHRVHGASRSGRPAGRLLRRHPGKPALRGRCARHEQLLDATRHSCPAGAAWCRPRPTTCASPSCS